MPAPKKPARPPAPPRPRDYASEAAGRATSKQTNIALTLDQRALLDRLSGLLGAPMKASILAATRAALAALDGGSLVAVKRELRSDLEPTKPGPKAAAATGDR